MPSATSPQLRTRLLEAIRQDPGASVSELGRCLGVHHSSAAYHLARLERRGLVALLRHRGRVHAFLAAVQGPDQRARLVLRRSPAAALVLARVAPGPQRLGAIAASLPITKAAVLWHLERLAALGLVAIEGPPRARTYRLAAPPPAQPAGLAFNPPPVTG